jgi:hypothetical protein
MQATNYLTLHSSKLATLQTSTLSLSTLTGSTIRASFISLSTLTVSSINGLLPGTGSGTWVAGAGNVTYYNIGNVGIGTTAPLGTLQVGHATPTGAGTSDGNIVIGKTTGTGYRYAKMGYDADFNLCIGDYGYAGGLSWVSTVKISYSAPVNSLTINGSGQVGIGTAIAVGSSNTLHVNGTIFASQDITAFSDQRYKQNIVRLDRSLDAICSISGYSYTRDDYRPGIRQIGLLAQEVKEVIPEAVNYDTINDIYSVNYNCLIAPVVEAIKELYDRSKAQAKIIEAQQSVIQSLITRLGSQ